MRRIPSLSAAVLIALFSTVCLSQSPLELACSLSGYPECVCTSCLVPRMPNYCPDLLDVTCPCTNTQYIPDVTACVLANCTTSEGERAWSIASSVCSSYGVTLPAQPPVKSSSRSTATPNRDAASATADTGSGRSTDAAGNGGSSAGGGGGLSAGAIAGIVIGIVGGIAAGAMITFLILRHRLRPQAPPPLPPQQPSVEQQMVQPSFVGKPHSVVAYPPPPPAHELHPESAPYLSQPPGKPQPQVVLPIPELRSPDNNRGPLPPAPTARWAGNPGDSSPLYEMPNR